MDADAFWALIEQSGRETRTQKRRLIWLDAQLSELPADDIIDFQMWLDVCEYRSNTWELWVAYLLTLPLGSDDGFLYFRYWLVGLGRGTFERVVADPDTLIEVPEVLHLWKVIRKRAGKKRLWTDDEWPEFELLAYVAWEPYKKRTGLDLTTLHEKAHARTDLDDDDYEIRGEQWIIDSEEELTRRFPRIAYYREGRT
ncbi:DUF4240 domain-containing protein [Streptosporangium sp. NPDC000509]|uniref:DUF4240 domain-containing protein n=1 Tax=Streptosporangium sp. NPDC000509 TaxID=3366186 RepID=UPI003689BD60